MKLISWNEIHDEIRAYVARVRCSKCEKRNTRSANTVRFLYILVALSTSSRFRIPIFYASSTRTHIYHNHLRLSICHVQITLIFQQCPADTFLFFIMLFQFLDMQNFVRSATEIATFESPSTCTRVSPVVNPNVSRKHFISRSKRFYRIFPPLIKASDSQ